MTSGTPRRTFLKTAGAIASGVAAATVGCAPTTERPPEATASAGLDAASLEHLAEAILPGELGTHGRRKAVDAFTAWVNGYEPVAQEMVGYGYSDIRYLPADPAPAWRAQLAALDLLAQKTRRASFASLDVEARRAIVEMALSGERGTRLPDPLGARHIALALLAHWASSPGAWNLALGVEVSPGACRPLDAATRKPLPIAGARA